MEIASTIERPRATSRVDQRDRPAVGVDRPAEPDDLAPQDRVTLSREAQEKGEHGDADAPDHGKQDGKRSGAAGKLTADEQHQVTELQQRDTHVRQHEAAHQAAGGSLTGGASYSYQVGPDGHNYAVGGEVPVRLGSGRTPDETISNARQARRAALAPSDPSPADLSVAAAATQLEAAAVRRKAQLAAKAYGKGSRGGEGEGGSSVRGAPGAAGDDAANEAAQVERTVAA